MQRATHVTSGGHDRKCPLKCPLAENAAAVAANVIVSALFHRPIGTPLWGKKAEKRAKYRKDQFLEEVGAAAVAVKVSYLLHARSYTADILDVSFLSWWLQGPNLKCMC